MSDEFTADAAALMPDVLERLDDLVRIPSVAFPGFDPEPGAPHGRGRRRAVRRRPAPRASGSSTCRTATRASTPTIPGPEGSPTVLLYAHYDVQPAPESQGWTSRAVRADARRTMVASTGAAPPTTSRASSSTTARSSCSAPRLALSRQDPRRGRGGDDLAPRGVRRGQPRAVRRATPSSSPTSDRSRVGRPGLTTALRGDVACTVTVRTLANPVHSGMFGGAAPTRITAMIRILDTLHDENGDTVIAGVDHGIVDRRRHGRGRLPRRLVDPARRGVPRHRVAVRSHLDEALGDRARAWTCRTPPRRRTCCCPEVTAKLSMRIIPGSDGEAQLEALMAHLRAQRPWNCEVVVERVKVGHAFAVDESHPAIVAAMDALSSAYGADVESIGSGASIPLVASLKKVVAERRDPAVGRRGHGEVAHPRVRRVRRPGRDRAHDRRADPVRPQVRGLVGAYARGPIRRWALMPPSDGEATSVRHSRRSVIERASENHD